jgi:hypothetical protein
MAPLQPPLPLNCKATLPVAVMNYAEKLDHLLRPRTERQPLVLDLFAGCGGLALGFEAQGLPTVNKNIDK